MRITGARSAKRQCIDPPIREEYRPVTMADLVRGTEQEYRKLGDLGLEAEFGPYFELVRSGR